MKHRIHPSPIGPLTLVVDDDGVLVALVLPEARHVPADLGERDDSAAAEAAGQLDEWFAGARTTFTLATHPRGTEFQRQVWAELARIPYGRTASYGSVAAALGIPAAARAVGAATGRNPLPIIVPCHRLVGSTGALTGYAGGLAAKAALLAVEARAIA